MTPAWNPDLALALEVADRADAIALDRFRALDLVVDTKPDLTPVSDADRAVEEGIRGHLGAARPEDAVLGEEFGTSGLSARKWIIDPIDGTKNYVRGVPVWATLIALAHSESDPASPAPLRSDDIVLGVVSAPAIGMRWWAAADAGAWMQTGAQPPRRIHVSAVQHIGDASVSYSDWNDPGWDLTGTRKGFQQLLETAWRSRAFGDFWSHMLVAEGAMDIAVEPVLSVWDQAALIPIVREAGGHVTSCSGHDPFEGKNSLSSNGVLHRQVVELLNS
jgi:histidinol-phosphatase